MRQAEPVIGSKLASQIVNRAGAIEHESDMGSLVGLLGRVVQTDKQDGSRLEASADL